MAYPFYARLQAQSLNMANGNFGLWYNKFIPVSDFESCVASDDRGEGNKAVSFYHRKYSQIGKKAVIGMLEQKHKDQESFCDAFSARYETIVIRARLKTPLITGIGESHPHEVSMVFEHNMGIPYIPASGIKGIVRFAHTIGLLDDIPPEEIKKDKRGKAYFDDEADWTNIPRLFGTQKNRGKVIFLDAYPEKKPSLHVDIMNPHYGKYYNGEAPPADYLDPNPIKFLTVAKDTVFIFRVLTDKNQPELSELAKKAFIQALTEEGVGAKTAVGYGIFDIEGNDTQLIPKDSIPMSETVSQSPKPPEPETWENVVITYAKNTGEVIAKQEGKSATTKDRSIIPEPMLEKLMERKRKKTVTATIKAEHIGGKNYRIIEII